MSAQDHNFCCGCLSADRKMLAVEDFWTKQCFLQILREIPVYKQEGHVPEWLCWECEALLRRFTKFKQQVAHSFNILQTYEMQKLDMKFPYQKPKLTIHKLNNINVPEISLEPETTEIELPITNEYDTTDLRQDIKLETDQIKSEIESHSDNDDLLINYVQKKKKVKKKRKKPEELFREIELTETEIEEERREMELSFEYVHAMFRCEKCIVSFPNAEMMKEHEAVKHESNAAHHKCAICTCTFVSEISYNYHANKHRRRYECCVCQVRTRSKRAAQKHYTTTHGIDASQENGETEGASNANTNGVKSEDTFPCELCAKTFKWKTSLRKHLETHRIEAGQKRRPYCEPCKMSFTTTSNLQKHVKTSSKHQIQLKLRKLEDTLPEESTTPEKQRAQIEQIKCSVAAARQLYPCAHCGKRFQWRGNLLRHLQSHTARSVVKQIEQIKCSVAAARQLYPCAHCGKRFQWRGNLLRHLQSHTARSVVKQIEQIKCSVAAARQLYPCAHCGKRFQWRGNLLRHLQSHTARANGELVCTPCNRTFSSVATYKQHMRLSRAHVSEQDFPHACDECGRRFANKTRLQDHVDWDHRRHFAHHCTQCQKVFKSHTSLYLHKQVVHKKEHAEHLCDHCGKPFPNHAKLRSHIIALHTSESPYKCTSCAARFSWHSCLSRHVRRVHKRK
ncbi:zinc finger protein 91-like [Cydia pomonella]|uniref:zinc finger protein 91-like n=1 Tax=Cydia pomonella TaxID=82600 RepID=UPI002ADE8DD4|nr:zinc finger protein 91-like [Cydia pomonella]